VSFLFAIAEVTSDFAANQEIHKGIHSMMRNRIRRQICSLAAFLAVVANVRAAETPCTQTQIDGTTAPVTTNYIYPRVPLQPFYQWANNNGYCGEANLIQSGLNNGQWMSQYDARLVCGSGLGQAGTCSTSKSTPNFNAQMLFESPNTGVSGTTEAWSSMPVCAANMRLNAVSYPYQGVAAQQPTAGCGNSSSTASPANCPGYQAYMSWVKQQVINGSQVSVAILISAVDGGSSDQYDHEVPVVKIGTNHSPTDPTYYADDVLYIEDHGNWNIDNNKKNATTYLAVPWGVNGTNNATSCTPFIYGYAFSALGMTNAQADKSTQAYEIVLPANSSIKTQTGGSGTSSVTITGPNNYAVAVSGVMDTYGETVPVALTAGSNPGSILASTTVGVANPQDPTAGLNYENPFIGTSTNGSGTGSCVNTPPSSWMTNFSLQPTVSGLTAGVSYNLYEYQFNTPTNDTLGGNGTWGGTTAAALAVPITAFNANSAVGSLTPANSVTNFTAAGSTYVANPLITTSDQIVVYRAVRASPGLYSPVTGSVLTSSAATFAWDSSSAGAGPDYGATAYWLDVGAEQGGHEYYSSGSLPITTFSQTVSGLSTNGSPVWARWYYNVSGNWQYTDYSYTSLNGNSGQGVITTPPPSSTLTGSSATFSWTAGASATAYWLDAGSTAGAHDYYSSGSLGNVLTTTVNNLPTNGATVYVTLYSLVNGTWVSTGYTYTAYSLAAAGGVLTTPNPGSQLTSGTVTFGWTAGSGATAYWLDAGSTTGAHDYYSSGNLGNVQTTTVSGLPTDGSAVYVTLYSLVGGTWSGNTYQYTALNATSGLAQITSPSNGALLSGSAVTFTWSSDSNATGYWVDVSAIGPAGNDLDSSGNLGLALTETIYNAPADGSTIYVTLYSLVGGQWLSSATTYTSGP
jgi:hypothetical protein